ncbi:MAG: L,D-transpeptidase [Myxococcales bacterium]|nr:L,D-transpeptidase [Myxococcales bacterium]
MSRIVTRLGLLCLLPLTALLGAGCAGDELGDALELEEGTELPTEDLPLGDVDADDMKADVGWGHATECKPIPSLPALVSPRIVVSLQGMTLHLSDAATGYDKVFPIGPGSIDTKAGSKTFGESLSYYPLAAYKTGDFSLRPATNTACKIWWTDPDTKQNLPVFAGLPFLSWSGSYGIHGPIDNFRAANGGSLRRGFVSHGCLRMESADVLEVYARIRTLANVPVHVQREPERTADGERVDVPEPWLGSECATDADCSFDGGFCKHNAYSERGFCSARCTKYCADKAGAPQSFCVADPDEAGKGMCLPKESSVNLGCRPYDHFEPATRARFNQASVTARVCVPGSAGWIGDHCLADADCQVGNSCRGATGPLAPGVCTQACTQYCPDQAGSAPTFCVNEPELGGATCVRQCTPASNGAECPAGFTCESRTRNGGSTVKSVCVPE